MSPSTEPQPTPEIIRLSIEDDEGVRATYPIIHEQIRVGRSEENEVCLNQRNISREHALLVAEPPSTRLIVHDLDSYTGIKLNGKRIFENCYLSMGDFLEIGGYVISLEMDGIGNEQGQRREQGSLKTEVEPLPPEQHGRLVIVSNNLAGREYYLNRVEMLIGREQGDNDLVINHRSISRNHAKIVWKNNEFTIIDLSSSNGVLIGSTPFSAARLVKGSIIQMGLVKFRYVAPGEDYTFNPVDLEVTTLDEPGYLKKIIGAILVFITIFFLSRQLISQFSEVPQHNDHQKSVVESDQSAVIIDTSSIDENQEENQEAEEQVAGEQEEPTDTNLEEASPVESDTIVNEVIQTPTESSDRDGANVDHAIDQDQVDVKTEPLEKEVVKEKVKAEPSLERPPQKQDGAKGNQPAPK